MKLSALFFFCATLVALSTNAQADGVVLEKGEIDLVATSCRGTHAEQVSAVEGYLEQQIDEQKCPLGDPPPNCIEVIEIAGVDYSQCSESAKCCIITGQANCDWLCSSSEGLSKAQQNESKHPKWQPANQAQ